MSNKTPNRKTATLRVYMARTSFVLIVIALVFGFVGGLKYFGSRQVANSSYISPSVGVQFSYPDIYILQEQPTEIFLRKGDQNIKIGKYGSNYLNVYDHVNSLIKLNKITVVEISPTSIAKREGLTLIRENAKGTGKSYFVLSNSAVYFLSTEVSSLFADLDAIVKTFRIIE